jgi:hypothetical protein
MKQVIFLGIIAKIVAALFGAALIWFIMSATGCTHIPKPIPNVQKELRKIPPEFCFDGVDVCEENK